MPINFFEANCKTESNTSQFGLCDDPPPANTPAYIDENDSSKWIAIVNNPNLEDVLFYGIDHCIIILKADGTQESRCDGMLSYSNNLIFVELKSRRSKKWFKKGREQLTNTINKFKLNHDIAVYDKVEAYVCNNLKPFAHTGQAANIQKFKDETGLILRGQKEINI